MAPEIFLPSSVANLGTLVANGELLPKTDCPFFTLRIAIRYDTLTT